MNIWIVEIGEPLPIEKDVRLHRYGEFSRYLAAQGHDVTWWTSTFSHAPKKNFFNEDTEKLVDGVKIKFLYGKGYSRNVSLARIKHHASFAKKFASLARKSSTRPDIIISPIPTIAASYQASKVARELGVKHVIDIRDYWPDDIANIAPKPVRFISRFILKKMYKDMEEICQNVNGIMGNSKVSIDYGLKFAKREQTASDLVFPLGYNRKEYSADSIANATDWYDKIQLDDESFKICFFGTIGRFFNLKTVIDASRELERKYNIDFLIGGDGSHRKSFEKYAEGANSVKFLGWLNGPQIKTVMDHSSLGLAPYIVDHPFALPNKVFEYMSEGLPVVSSIQLEMPKILKENDCGITYDGSVQSLVSAIEELIGDTGKREEMSKNALSLYNLEFKTEQIFKKANQHLISLAQK